MGLKLFGGDDGDGDGDLSAEPLVGLKQSPTDHAVEELVLSAEPLVGLKLPSLAFCAGREVFFQPNPSWV